MAYYRRKYPPKVEAKMGISIAIFGILVSVACLILGVIIAIGMIQSDKGSLMLRIIGAIAFFGLFFGGGGIGGLVACIGSLKNSIEALKKAK